MKILASDFDNTLLFYQGYQGYYHQEDIQAIKEFQKQGNLFGICSGRSFKGIVDWNFEKIDYDFYIICSGAKILDKEGKVIFEQLIDKKIAVDILKAYPTVNTSIVYQGDTYLLNAPENYIKHPRITSFAEVGDKWETFSLHFADNETAHHEYLKIKEQFKDQIAIYQNECHLDFAAMGCSKGAAILKLIEHFKIDPFQMAVIGDSYNDLPMLTAVENAFTFNRSPDLVKQTAKYLVDGVDECIKILMGE